MDRKAVLNLAHLQLTRRCNLRCKFCGQWGEHGFMRSGGSVRELTTDEWLAVAEDICETAGEEVRFTIWGGEPLLSESLHPVLKRIRELGSTAGLVTNGVLLGANARKFDGEIDTLFLSIDGIGATHDRIRGVPGVYERAIAGAAALPPSIKVVAMTVICDDNIGEIERLPDTLAARIPNLASCIISHQMFMSDSGCRNYRRVLNEHFAFAAGRADAWRRESFGALPGAAADLCERMRKRHWPVPIRFGPPLTPAEIIRWYNSDDAIAEPRCVLPWRHLSVRADGEADFCVDFDDFSLGSVKTESVKSLFYGERAEKFRRLIAAAALPCCRRCVWNFQPEPTPD